MVHQINYNNIEVSQEDKDYIESKIETITRDGGSLLSGDGVLLTISFKETNHKEKEEKIECDICLSGLHNIKDLYSKCFGPSAKVSIDICEEKILHQIRKENEIIKSKS